MSNRTAYATGIPQQYWSSIAGRDYSSILVANNDIVNPISVGQSGSVSSGGGDTVQIAPLGTMSFPANRDLWFLTTGPTVQFFIIPDGTSWTPSPVQIAQQNALAGIGTSVPRIVLATQIIGSNTAFGPFDVTFPFGGSYEIACDNLGLNSQVADITVKHLDQNDVNIYTENYTVAIGAVGNNNPVIVRGNLQGSKLRITGLTCTSAYMNALGLITGPFTAGNLNLTVYGTSLQIAETRPKMAPSNVQGGILQEIEGVALLAGASQGPVQMPSYAGRAIMDAFSPGTLARGTIQGFKVVTGATPQFTYRLNQIGAGSTETKEIIIPQFFCTLLELNGDTVGRTPAVHVMEADFL